MPNYARMVNVVGTIKTSKRVAEFEATGPVQVKPDSITRQVHPTLSQNRLAGGLARRLAAAKGRVKIHRPKTQTCGVGPKTL